MTVRLVLVIVGNPAYLPGMALGVPCGMALGLISVLGAHHEHDHTGLWHRPEPYQRDGVSRGGDKLPDLWPDPAWRAFAHEGLSAFPPPWGLIAPGMIVGYVSAQLVVLAGRLRRKPQPGSGCTAAEPARGAPPP